MWNKKISPYLSIAFANRNDQYTSDQSERIEAFIQYYVYLETLYPDLFEFIVCDWNPPSNKKLLKHQYPWEKLNRVKHLVVSEQIHQKLCPDQSRPILDYTARNACIRRASAPFVMITNQDIFPSLSIFKKIAKRTLSKRFFYRGDRCDFDFDYSKKMNWAHFDQYASCHVREKHIRPTHLLKEMSFLVNPDTHHEVYTKKKWLEIKINKIIYSNYYSFLRKVNNRFFSNKRPSYKDHFLHTNASGDFLIASKEAFEKVHGCVETNAFYMHLDSYLCIQLFAAGYHQAIFAYPHTVFHSHHSREGREGRSESMSYAEHREIFNCLCMDKQSYRFNPPNWGLTEYAEIEDS
jgi:hypothetical protein